MGRWNPWKTVHFQSVKNVVKEIWCLYLTLVVKGQQFTTKPGYAPILIAATISKSGMVKYTLMSPFSVEHFTLAHAENLLINKGLASLKSVNRVGN